MVEIWGLSDYLIEYRAWGWPCLHPIFLMRVEQLSIQSALCVSETRREAEEWVYIWEVVFEEDDSEKNQEPSLLQSTAVHHVLEGAHCWHGLSRKCHDGINSVSDNLLFWRHQHPLSFHATLEWQNIICSVARPHTKFITLTTISFGGFVNVVWSLGICV